ncbi:hypothetical protein SCLCIDRAFT_623034 [Scleroderma citrinum Foug A]|uniref:Uncharacterized protein n=1 Tax=Scleroderma citrinum Foug A TaxID=1036808 RepID=A0A0C3D5D2_9AGAM|nr:hypothetical protein SCLCIDRAFT_623034 [Scleroderma citrinum Foug A]
MSPIDSPWLLEPVIVALQCCPLSILPSGRKKKKKKKKPLIHPRPLKPTTMYAWKMLKAVHPEELSPSKELQRTRERERGVQTRRSEGYFVPLKGGM